MKKGNITQPNNLRARLSLAAGLALVAAGLTLPAIAQNNFFLRGALTPTTAMRTAPFAAQGLPTVYPYNDYTGRTAGFTLFNTPNLSPQDYERMREYEALRQEAAREFIQANSVDGNLILDGVAYPLPSDINPYSDPMQIEPQKTMAYGEETMTPYDATDEAAPSDLTERRDNLTNGDASGDPTSPGSADMSDVPANNGPDMHEANINEEDDSDAMSSAAQNDTYSPANEQAGQDDTSRDMTDPAEEQYGQPDDQYADPEAFDMAKSGAQSDYRDASSQQMEMRARNENTDDVEAAPSDVNSNVETQQSMSAADPNRPAVSDDVKPDDNQ